MVAREPLNLERIATAIQRTPRAWGGWSSNAIASMAGIVGLIVHIGTFDFLSYTRRVVNVPPAIPTSPHVPPMIPY
jgi:hypothetical protein